MGSFAKIMAREAKRWGIFALAKAFKAKRWGIFALARGNFSIEKSNAGIV
jgi:hypothetical protein